jgi:hypothetical protein
MTHRGYHGDSDFCDDFEPDFADDGYCDACGGDGWILTCCDDICHGLGYCMHGDGMEMGDCNDSGEPPRDAPADWQWTPPKAQE